MTVLGSSIAATVSPGKNVFFSRDLGTKPPKKVWAKQTWQRSRAKNEQTNPGKLEF